MIPSLPRFRPLALIGCLALLPAAAFAEDPSDPAFPGVVAPAPDATHWGLGLGAGSSGARYRGEGYQTSAIPLILYDSTWLHAFGSTLDLKLPSYEALHFALRAKYALGDGYRASDSAYLYGMDERKGSLMLGGAASWKTPLATFSIEWLKAVNNSHGQQAQFTVEHPFRYGRLEIVPHLGAQWSDSSYVDYYYGVTAPEATAARPAYRAGASTDVSAGLRLTYALKVNQMLLLDVADTRRGKGVTDSPLSDRSSVPSLKLGYLYQFK
jgi:outer membrane protein